MKTLARSYVWWLSIDKEIEATAKDCRACRVHNQGRLCIPGSGQLSLAEIAYRFCRADTTAAGFDEA